MSVQTLKQSLQRLLPWLTRETLLAAWAKLFLPGAARMSKPDRSAPIYVAGLFHSHAGVASGARAQLDCMRREGKEVYAIDLTAALKQRFTVEYNDRCYRCDKLPIDRRNAVVVVHQNPRWFLIALHRLGRRFLRNKYIIGYWAWELENIPDWWVDSIDYVHEIWVPSNFVKDALARHTDKPIKVVPHPCRITPERGRSFAADGKLRVLYIFDFGSSFERKNPLAAVKAFKLAFGGNANAELVIKAARTSMYPEGRRQLEEAVTACNNIRLINQFMEQDELDRLYRTSDIYLSLHRSEGFGLTIHEAMAFGLECVATGWSGNMDFFNGPQCHPVTYKLIPINDPQNIYPYPESRWADPDIDHAAQILRRIAEQHHC